MSNITVSTDSNFDDAGNLALGNGENITINYGVTLTLNSDNWWSQNAAVMGNVYSYGTFNIDGTTVWAIPYDGGTSTVPAIGSTLTGATSGATGEVIGTYSALGVVPTAAGVAMPSTGWIKLRSKSGDFQDNENLQVSGTTKAVVNSSTGGQRGWLTVLYKEGVYNYTYRGGKFKVRGDWFNLGVTNGTRGQTMQFPVAAKFPGVWIETAVGAGTYEFWPNVDSNFTTTNYPTSTTDKRYKVCKITTAGQLQIGKTGTTDTAYLPASGLNVRIPNVLMGDTDTGFTAIYNNYSSGFWFSTLAGDIDIDGVSFFDCISVFPNCKTLSIKNTQLHQSMNFQKCPSVLLDNIGSISGITTTNTAQNVTIQNCHFQRYTGDSSNAETTTGTTVLTSMNTVTLSNNTFRMILNNAYNVLWSHICALNCQNLTISNNTFIGAGICLSAGNNITITNMIHAAYTTGTSRADSSDYPIYINQQPVGVKIDGYSFFDGMTNIHANSQIVFAQSGINLDIRNIGSKTTALAIGSLNKGTVTFAALQNVYNFSVKCCYMTGNTSSTPITTTNCYNGLIQNVYADVGASNHPQNEWNTLIKNYRAHNIFTTAQNIYDTIFYASFESDTTGLVGVLTNEQLNTTAYTVNAGTPRFSGDGKLWMANLNDEIEYTFPYFILGYTAFSNSAINLTGVNTGNHTITYDIDTGSGFSGSYKATSGANLSAETISSTTGFRLKIKIVCNAASATNELSKINFSMVTTASDQKTEYPLDVVTATMGITNLLSGSKVKVYKQSDRSLLAGTDSSGTSFSYTYDWTTDVPVYIQVIKSNYIPIWYDQFSLTSTGFAIPAIQQADRVYKNP